MSAFGHDESAARAAAEQATVLGDWLTLCKPRIAGFVFLAALTGGFLGSPAGSSWSRVLEASAWICLSSAAASIFNQWIERDTDRLMQRTRYRPLADRRLSGRDALLVGALFAALAIGGLALRFNLLSALLTLSTLSAYALLYTPLKRLSSLNTVVGAVPGAMPPVLGFAALAGTLGPWSMWLFAILFTWQFPHFMAIAWIHREDYARAGHRMLPALPGSAGAAGSHAVVYALVLLPVSLLPTLQGGAGSVYLAVAAVLSLLYLIHAIRFAHREELRRARWLLWISLLYLPLLFAAILCDPSVRRLEQLQ